MQKYTKINTMYKRYVFQGLECPNEKWKRFKNQIILGEFSDKVAEYLFNGKHIQKLTEQTVRLHIFHPLKKSVSRVRMKIHRTSVDVLNI